MRYPFDQSMREALPLPLDEYPEPMRRSIEQIRRVTRRRKVINGLLAVPYYAAILCLLVTGAALLAMAMDRNSPVDVATTVVTPLVPVGGKLVVRMRVDRHRACQSRAMFGIFDGESRITVTDLPWADARGLLGLDKPFERTFTVPADATPGEGRIRIERSYRCPYNVFHQFWPITDVSRDYAFTIVPAKAR